MDKRTSGQLAMAHGWFKDHKIQINGDVYIITHLSEDTVIGVMCVQNGVVVNPYREVQLDLLVKGWESYD
jgi:hypothetical protein